MGVIETKVFQVGEDGGVRVPKEFGFPPGTMVTIGQTPRGLEIVAVEDRAAIQRNLRALADEITQLWADAGGPPPREVRDPDIFPDRPGLY